jgi:hypothetical protein
MPIFGLSLSLSFSRWLSKVAANCCGVLTSVNFAIFVLILAIHYFLLVIWLPTARIILDFFIDVTTFVGDNLANFKHVSAVLTFVFLILPGIFERSIQKYYSFIGDIGYHYFQPHGIIKQFEEMLSFTAFGKHTSEGYVCKILQLSESYLIPILRLSASLIFVGSFLLRPLIMKPLLLIWARIVESDKPVFTLLGGGVSSLAVAASEVVKHL